MPGSIFSTARELPSGTLSHEGHTSSFSPTAMGLKYAFQLLAQSSSSTILTLVSRLPSSMPNSASMALSSFMEADTLSSMPSFSGTIDTYA